MLRASAARPVEGSHAIVVGGSIAGLGAARVLADHFKRVTVIERDRLPAGPVPRRGVPQALHQHALLVRGRLVLEELFPGVGDELVAADAVVVDPARDVAMLGPRGWAVRVPSELRTVAASRQLLEWCVRRRVAELPRVGFRGGVTVTGLLSEAPGVVSGVALRSSERTEGVLEPLHGDLVIDASGRGSRAPQWLEGLGYEPPQEIVVNAHAGYASRVYRLARHLPYGLSGALVRSAPPDCTRGGVIMPIEGGRALITLVGFAGDHPPTDELGFTAFARSLRSPLIWEAMRDAQPLTPIAGSRSTQNRLRRYEHMRRRPEGFVVLGDAACAFNPVFQQGMSTALLGAIVLREALRGPRRGRAGRFQRRLARLNRTPWAMATAQDLRFQGAEGATPPASARLAQAYMSRLSAHAARDAEAGIALLRVVNMTTPLRSLVRPRLALAAAGWYGRGRG